MAKSIHDKSTISATLLTLSQGCLVLRTGSNFHHIFQIFVKFLFLLPYLDSAWKMHSNEYKQARGALNFFSGRGVRPGFPKCGACELTFASEKGGLWAENFQIWGLVSWKFPNLGACELKFGWKLRLLRLKFQNFLKRGSCELTLLLEMGPLRVAGEAWKGGLQGCTSPYPLSRSVPPTRKQA